VAARTLPILAWAACSAALALLVVRHIVPDAENPNTSGFSASYVESRILLGHPVDLAKIYDTAWFQQRIDDYFVNVHEVVHGQPPTMSLLMLPLAWLSPAKARIAWIGLSIVLWISGLGVLSSCLGLPPIFRVPPIVWLAALTSRYPPLMDNLQRGQGYAALFFLLSLFIAFSMRATTRGAWLAGILLGSMLVLKSAGLWLIPVLLLGRRWRIVAAALLTASTIVLLLSPLVGLAPWHNYLLDGPKWVLTDPSNYASAYQTVRSLAGHLFIYDATWNPAPLVRLPWMVSCLTTAISVAVLLVSVRFDRLDSRSRERRALTLGMLTAPLVPLAPIGEGHHYMLLLPALVISWWVAARARPRMLCWAALVASTFLICVPLRYYQSPSLRDGWLALLSYPRVYGALGLWALLVALLRGSATRADDDEVAVARREPAPREVAFRPLRTTEGSDGRQKPAALRAARARPPPRVFRSVPA